MVENSSSGAFPKLPGRCLRNRWLSIDSVERIIVSAVALRGKVFGALWGYYCDDHAEAVPLPPPQAPLAKARPRAKNKARDPGQDEKDAFQERQRATRTLAAKLTQCRLFLAMVMIASITRQPLVHLKSPAKQGEAI